MKKFLLTLFGVIVLSQGMIETKARHLSYTLMCIDGHKYMVVTQGYAAISTIQVYEKSEYAHGTPKPAECK